MVCECLVGRHGCIFTLMFCRGFSACAGVTVLRTLYLRLVCKLDEQLIWGRGQAEEVRRYRQEVHNSYVGKWIDSAEGGPRDAHRMAKPNPVACWIAVV